MMDVAELCEGKRRIYRRYEYIMNACEVYV
jgi:hypothetical protein